MDILQLVTGEGTATEIKHRMKQHVVNEPYAEALHRICYC